MIAKKYEYIVFPADVVLELFRPVLDEGAYVSENKITDAVQEAIEQGINRTRIESGRAMMEAIYNALYQGFHWIRTENGYAIFEKEIVRTR